MENEIIKLNKEVVKDYVNLDLPEITIRSTGTKGNVVEVSAFKGGMTLTVRPHKTEDAEFEVLKPKQIENKKV